MSTKQIVIRVLENGYVVEWTTTDFLPLCPAIVRPHAKVCPDLGSLLDTVKDAAGKKQAV